MRRRWPSVLVRVLAAGLAVWLLRAGLDRLPAQPSVWVRGPAAFALAKLGGDAALLLFFRGRVVFFFEDLFWEFAGFALLGALAAGLISLAAALVGGPLEPYFLALAVYFVYLIAETRQQSRADRE